MIKKILDKKKEKAGFTLIELVLYMGLYSILMIIIMQLFSSIFDLRLESEATSSVNNDGKYIIQRLTYDVNRATDIVAPDLLGSPSTTLRITVDDQDLVYSILDGNLILNNLETGTNDQLNSEAASVSDISFIRLDGNGKDVVQLMFTLTSDVSRQSGKEIETFQTSVGIR